MAKFESEMHGQRYHKEQLYAYTLLRALRKQRSCERAVVQPPHGRALAVLAASHAHTTTPSICACLKRHPPSEMHSPMAQS